MFELHVARGCPGAKRIGETSNGGAEEIGLARRELSSIVKSPRLKDTGKKETFDFHMIKIFEVTLAPSN